MGMNWSFLTNTNARASAATTGIRGCLMTSGSVQTEKGERMSRLEKDDFGTLAICAIRYCHGRQTYMPDLVRGIIKPHLKELSDEDLNVMIEDCDFQERMHLYGDERIDKPGWIKWREELIAERERRTNG